ncbi:MAG: hemerythrin domain-containing protein [Azoarcus sp.]|nr:hemerythrin domain-containing protein [Azoarcus sp.]
MKRDPSLLALSREHHTALSLAIRLKKTVQSGDPLRIEEARDNVVVRFAAELEPHFAEEERTLLPRLATLGEVALVDRTLDEHRSLRALVRKLADPAATHAAGAFLAEFGDLLTAHVRFEERELFERAQVLYAEHGATPKVSDAPV